MPVLKYSTNLDRFYVVSTFRRDGERVFVTHQITPDGVAILEALGLDDGEEVPDDVFYELIEQGHLYTGATGSESAGIDPRATMTHKDFQEWSFKEFAPSLANLVCTLAVCHPSYIFKGGDSRKNSDGSESFELTFDTDGAPPYWVEYLFKLARLPHGEQFLTDLGAAFAKYDRTRK